MRKKVFITGATGLIGKETIKPLLDSDYTIYALTRKIPERYIDFVNWIVGDFFDVTFLNETFGNVKPEYLLHFAWKTSGDYLTSDINYTYLDSSIAILDSFAKNGGRRAVYAGTGFEYAAKGSPLVESDQVEPKTVYAKSKNDLRMAAEIYANVHNIDFCWGRIFNVYGHNENSERFFPSIIHRLRSKQNVVIRSGQLIRDYIYAPDAALAFCQLLNSDCRGIFNICTGTGLKLENIARLIASLIKREEFLTVNYEPSEPLAIVGSNFRLCNETGFRLRHSTEDALHYILKENLQ